METERVEKRTTAKSIAKVKATSQATYRYGKHTETVG